MHAGNRCRPFMTSRPRGTVNQQTRWTRKIQRKAFLFGYSPSQLPGGACARTFLWKGELRFGASKVETQKQKHNVHAYIRKKKPKRSILRTEKCGDLTTAEHKIFNEWRESRNKHRYAVVVQGLATLWNPCQTKTSQETEKNLRQFLQPSQNPKVIHTYKLFEFGKYCEELLWNRRTTTLHRSETSGIEDRAVRRAKEETSAVLLQIWIGWLVVVEFYGMLLLFARGPRPPGRRDISKWTKIWWILLGRALFAGGILGKRYSDCWDWRIGKVGCIRNISQKTECERSPDNPKRLRICISYGRWFSKIIRKKLRIPRTHSETGIHRKERESQRRISRR